MERKLGEIFTYKGKTYQVVKASACKDCAFKVRCEALESITGTCIPRERTDNTSVSFKLINNMEIKNNQLTIDIPEGMEIDLENSDLANGIIKFRDKWLTLERIHGSAKEDCYLTNRCGIKDFHDSKLVAIANLMDIAKYYNKDWKPSWISSGQLKYYIYYSNENNKYQIGANTRCDYGAIYFRLRDYVQAVIDNPNFRDILDAVYKN